MIAKVMMTFVSLLVIPCGLSRYAKNEEVKVEQTDTIMVQKLGRVEKGNLFIERDVDLKGAVCIIPKGTKLVFKRGIIRNGILVGNNTKITGKDKVFDKVTIQGSWIVPNISTDLFVDLGYLNALRNVMALANANIQNNIIIKEGNYQVVVEKDSETCLTLCSNTNLIMNGTIQINPNEYDSYNILELKGENIHVEGKGKIIGDKHTHKGDTGEWGMGIMMKNVVNASVSGLTIKDCWGDCIYIGKKSQNILIENCVLDNGRRQGISVTGGDGITIRDIKITNVSGTNPQYAIDVEPNAGNTCDNITIDNVEVIDCVGGIVITAVEREGVKKAWVGNVVIKNCNVSSTEKYPLRIRSGISAIVENNTFNTPDKRIAVYITDVDSVTVTNNTVKTNNGLLSTIKNNVRKVIKGASYKHIKVLRSSNEDVHDNMVYE